MTCRTSSRILFLAPCLLVASCSSSRTASPTGRQDFAAIKQVSASGDAAPGAPNAVFPEAAFDFGKVPAGAAVEHDFIVRNPGAAPMAIEKVSMTPPLLVTAMPRAVAPGAEARIHFKLDTADLDGKFAGIILVFLSDPALPEAQLALSGLVVPPIELLPRPAFFVAGQRGQGNRDSIEIVNHEPQPLHIEKIDHPADRFTTRLETLEAGQRYRLTLALNPGGPGGRAAGTIRIKTSSKRIPVLSVAANTYLYERVHAFPDAVDFGTLRAGDAGRAAVTLMIHQEGGTDFKVQLSTDVPGLSFQAERGPKGDRYQTEIALAPGKLPAGPIKGSIFIDTNDPEFPRIVVPVNGQITGR